MYESLIPYKTLRETAVDCDQCPSQLKCCTYRPFIANFLVGMMIRSGTLAGIDLSEWDWLPVGLAPSLKYRKKFEKEKGWGFGESEGLLCQFYERRTGRCRVWAYRPGVCRTFFCKSSTGESGLKHWERQEEMTWSAEWGLLENFMCEEGWTGEEISMFKEYLHEDYLKQPRFLSDEYCWQDWQKASDFYLRAAEYVEALPEGDRLKMIGYDSLASSENVD